MKKPILLFLAVALFGQLWSQNEASLKNDEAKKVKKVEVKVSGFVRYETFYDTYKSVEAREGDVYLYPSAASYDANNIDINEVNQLEMISFQSRLNFGIKGPDAFGAKTSGAIEGDFLGTGDSYTRMLRLRHAYMKLNWKKTELLMGQYWHPMFVTQNFPATVSMGAGVPFHILNRSPQLRMTYKVIEGLTISEALIMHGYHLSKGPLDAQRNAGLPEMTFQAIYTKGAVLAGFTTGYKWLKPRLTTATNVITDETIGSMSATAFFKLSLKPVTIKLEGIYGENLSHFVMIGGYGAAQDPTLSDDYSYSNLQTLSLWGDVQTNGKKIVAALFGGYSANLGSKDPYFELAGYTRSGTISHIYRISPRLMFNSGKTQFGLEYLLTGAVYDADGVLDANGKADVLADPTINHRFLFSAKYAF